MLSIVMLAGSLLLCIGNGYDLTKTLLILTLVMFKAVESISDVFYGVMQRHHKLYIAGYSLTIKAITSIALFVLIDLVTKDILLASISVVIVNAFVFLFYDLRQVSKLEDVDIRMNNARIYYKQAISVLKITFPVFIVSFLSIFSLNVPRFFIDRFHGSENAYFGIMAMPITLILLVMTFILQPNIVALSEDFKNGKLKKFRKTLAKVGVITALVGVLILGVTYLIGDSVLTLVFGIDFTDYRIELTIIVLGAVLNAFVAIGVNILTVMRRFKGLFYTLLLTSLLLIPISYVFVMRNSIMGGVISFAVVCTIQSIALYFVYRFSLKDKLKNE